MTLIPAFDVVVSRNKVVVDLGTLTDDYEPEIAIHTTATDKVTGEKSIVAGKDVYKRQGIDALIISVSSPVVSMGFTLRAATMCFAIFFANLSSP